MSRLRIPPPLRPGDRVALFSPSAHAGRDSSAQIERALEQLRSWGLRVHPPPAEARHLYLAGTDAQRAEHFQELYTDPQFCALFATRGGYGTARILPLLQLQALRAARPKAVVGMSDVSALLIYLAQEVDLATFHGPCLAAPGTWNTAHVEANLEDLRRELFQPQERVFGPLRILHWPAAYPTQTHAPLHGGCLSVLAASAGTPWALRGAGSLLILEDLHEAPYRLDRYLTQLTQAGCLEDLRGVLFGHLSPADAPESVELLEAMLRDVFRQGNFPVLRGLPMGHGACNMSWVLGQEALLRRESETTASLILCARESTECERSCTTECASSALRP